MGPDFYAELNRHGLEEETVVNGFEGLAATHDVKLVASNNSYYTVKTKATPTTSCFVSRMPATSASPRYVGKRGREFRFGFPNDSFYLKSPEEMKALFVDVPRPSPTSLPWSTNARRTCWKGRVVARLRHSCRVCA